MQRRDAEYIVRRMQRMELSAEKKEAKEEVHGRGEGGDERGWCDRRR